MSFCKDLAHSLAYLLKENLFLSTPCVLIGQDARLSSPEIVRALEKHLKEEGVAVTSIGVAPSPLCYFLLHHYNLSATIVVTASHNPPEYNGFKILLHKNLKTPSVIPALKKLVKNKSKSLKKTNNSSLSFTVDPFTPYISSLKKEFSLKPPSFIVDTGNGALGPLAEKTFEAFNLKTKILFSEPDGHFPNHHPDPTVEENLKDLKQSLAKSSACFGVAFDGDGDRLVLVTKQGRTLLGDELASLFLPSLLKKKGGSIVADVKCSDWFFSLIKKLGGTPIMSKSGHTLTRQTMEKNKASVAFEFSGHYFFNDRVDRGFDDALYACFRLLEILEGNKPLENLLPKIESVSTGEIRISMTPKKQEESLNKIKGYLQNKNEPFVDLDGVRLSRPTQWALFRSSKTEESLTMRFESLTDEDLALLKKEFFSLMGLNL